MENKIKSWIVPISTLIMAIAAVFTIYLAYFSEKEQPDHPIISKTGTVKDNIPIVESEKAITTATNEVNENRQSSSSDNIKTEKPIIKKYIELPYINKSLKKDLSIYIKTNKNFDVYSSEKIAASFSKKYSTNSGLFGNKNLSDKYFTLLYSIDEKTIKNLELKKYTKYLCIGNFDFQKASKNTSTNTFNYGLIISIKIIDLNSNNSVSNINKLIKGVGFTENEAKQNSINKAIDYIKNNSI